MTNDPIEASNLLSIPRHLIGSAWFGPAVLAVLFMAVLGGLMWLIQSRAVEVNRADLHGNIRTAQESIRQRLRASSDYLTTLAEDMARGTVTEELFSRRLAYYMKEHPELVSIVYVDAGGTALWAVPTSPEAKVIGSPLACPRSLEGCVKARKTRNSVYSAAHISLQGEPAFDLSVPIYDGERFRGSIVGVYSCERMLRHMLHEEILQKYRAGLIDPAGNVIASLPAAARVDEQLTAVATLDPPGRVSLRLARYGAGFWGVGMALLMLLCVGLVTGMSWGMWSLKRQIARRAQAERMLREARDQLTERVRDRTADLEIANEQLQREMSERQRAEERARQRQAELAHVGRVSTMGEMAASLAHELNQPLGAITSFAEGSIRLIEADEAPREALHAALTEVSNQAMRAGRIIRRLRSFVATGEPQRSSHDLRQLIDEVVDLMAMDIRQEQINFSLDVSETLSPVLVDGIQAQQVLLNLIRNAIEAMRQVDADARRLVVAAAPAGDDMIEVTVSDSGPGCPPETVSKIFDAFFSTKEAGLGMGLSISRSIIEAHRGLLWATANASRGLTVHFTIPAANGDDNATAR